MNKTMDKTTLYKVALERIAEVSSVTYENVGEMDRTLINSGYVSGTAEMALRIANELKEDDHD